MAENSPNVAKDINLQIQLELVLNSIKWNNLHQDTS